MGKKFIVYEQCTAIQQYSGLPVELSPDMRFDWMTNMNNVPGLVHKVIASATNPTPNTDVSGFNVGGIEVYRNDPKDYPYILNKDVYAVISGISPSGLIAQGPLKDDEHWLKQMPERYSGIPLAKK